MSRTDEKSEDETSITGRLSEAATSATSDAVKTVKDTIDRTTAVVKRTGMLPDVSGRVSGIGAGPVEDDRRRVLAGAAAAATVGLTGCGADGAEEGDTETNGSTPGSDGGESTPESSNDEEQTPTETEEPTESSDDGESASDGDLLATVSQNAGGTKLNIETEGDTKINGEDGDEATVEYTRDDKDEYKIVYNVDAGMAVVVAFPDAETKGGGIPPEKAGNTATQANSVKRLQEWDGNINTAILMGDTIEEGTALDDVDGVVGVGFGDVVEIRENGVTGGPDGNEEYREGPTELSQEIKTEGESPLERVEPEVEV
jgi:hypothetical protein